MAATDVQKTLEGGVRALNLNGHVGFDSLPDQLVNKCVNQGFNFNILCLGETGIGKSTLMDTLFNTRFNCQPSTHDLPGVKLKSNTFDLTESNVHLKLTVVDTVGFGDQVNKEETWKPIVDYINQQFELYLQEELKIKRSLHGYHDTRIHACLYFIAPTGHSLKALDMVAMKELDKKINIIPVIAKADTITKAELSKFKLKLMNELKASNVQIYTFPTDDATVSETNAAISHALMNELKASGVQIYTFPTDDATVSETNATMNTHLPFAVVGSDEEMKVGNKVCKVRQYPWGVVQVENENHCDFVKLREMLIRTNMEDLRETTHTKHYERYRCDKLEKMGFSDSDTQSLSEVYETKRKDHMSELQQKEDEMRQSFVIRVKETETELKESEKELHSRFDLLKKQHADEKKKLEDSRKKLEDQTNNLEMRQKAVAQNATLKKPKK